MSNTVLPAGSGFTRLQLDFKYDHAGRRVQKKVTNLDSGQQVAIRRYLYDGWNLIAELDGSGTSILRSHTWGLDISGGPAATGAAGALLKITNGKDSNAGSSYFPAYDANGNVAALMRDNGILAALSESSFSHRIGSPNGAYS